MRDFKTSFWVTLLILASIFVYQNQHFFFQASYNFRINLLFKTFTSPNIPSSLIFIICIAFGFILAYALSIPGRLTSRKKIKLLQKAVDSQIKEISSLNNQLDNIKSEDIKTTSEHREESHSTYR